MTGHESAEDFADICGRMCARALRAGGENLLFRVEGRLGPAMRLTDRVRTGSLELSPAVELEIQRSIQDAERLLLGVEKIEINVWRPTTESLT